MKKESSPMKAWLLLLFAVYGVFGFSGCQAGKAVVSEEADAFSSVIEEELVDENLAGDEQGSLGRLLLEPDNTQITFQGKAGPMTQSGSFQRFSGFIDIQGKDPAEAKLEVQIEMDSVKTRIGLLTRHLKSKDFFEVKNFPTASFLSTSIEATDELGSYELNGRLTVHGVTRHVKIPAKIQIRPTEVLMEMEWIIKQSDYRMEKATLRTQDAVPITVTASIPRNTAE